MAERAHRPAETKKSKRRHRLRIARDSNGRFLAVKLPTSSELSPARRTRPDKERIAADPNAASAYFQHLSSLAEKADRNETSDSTGMTGDGFLASFLGR
jgi:hypothetical protein